MTDDTPNDSTESARPADCRCKSTEALPCWPCWRDGYNDVNPAGPADTDSDPTHD